jgi:hypothetical protein
MAFDGSEGGAIKLSAAAAMTKEYRLRGGSSTHGHFFGRDAFLALLEQSGCVGIRIYYGMNPENGNKELIMVGADCDENDMLDLVMDFSVLCPSSCSTENELNSEI